MAKNYLDPFDANAGLAIWHQDVFDESTLRARAVDDILRRTGGLINKCALGLFAGAATAAVTASGSTEPSVAAPALVGMATTLISYGLSRYQRSPEVKGLFHVIDASLSKELIRRVGVETAISEQVHAKTAKALQSMVANNIYQGAYAYRASISGALLKQHLSPMNLVEFCRETMAMLRHKKSIKHFENFFGQRTQFEVNLAHLAAMMGASENYDDLLVGFDHPNVRAFMKKSPDILPLFSKNKIHLDTMLNSLRLAIGPDASLVFGKESLDVNKVNQLLRPLLVESAVMAKRQAEIHNISQLLLNIAVDLASVQTKAKDTCWDTNGALKVSEELRSMLVEKQREHLQRNVSPVEPERAFKYQAVLDACDTLISWTRTSVPAVPFSDEDALTAELGALLFPKEKDRPYQQYDAGSPGKPVVILNPKTIYDAYANGMQDALKDALRKSSYVNDFFSQKTVAVDAVATRIMTKVFLIAHAEHHAMPQGTIESLCGDKTSETELAFAMQSVLNKPESAVHLDTRLSREATQKHVAARFAR